MDLIPDLQQHPQRSYPISTLNRLSFARQSKPDLHNHSSAPMLPPSEAPQLTITASKPTATQTYNRT
ncbi:hypothetical protein BU16DRAFT_527055 [Lophium mytilinum]|uniref:Uncharacterized protein n=1 Tax=Lophium mytilinum TaxID=390894 RepID=A0A6A6QT83_9PEZI|nr:hypothetical protein BU16DRAFT_527055 [Lophium mytilinum]